jgi:hypothetical protein
MVDHLAWAQGYRNRAAKCQLSAKNTSSVEFGGCYRLLEKYYIMLANLEEDFERRQLVSLELPVAPKEADKQAASLKKREMRLESQPPAPSVTARMPAVR